MADLTEKTLAAGRKYTGKIISVDLIGIEPPDRCKVKREVNAMTACTTVCSESGLLQS